MNYFSYHSEQSHSLFTNGKGYTQRNSVDIKDGKGTKAVETYDVNGKRLSRQEKMLTASELDCIQRNKFIPGLFKDCIKPLRSLPLRLGTMRSRTKTRRRHPK